MREKHEDKIDGTITFKQGKKMSYPKTRKWFLETVQTRNVSDRLNELSKNGYTVFCINQSVSVGGSYEVVFYIDERAKSEDSEQ